MVLLFHSVLPQFFFSNLFFFLERGHRRQGTREERDWNTRILAERALREEALFLHFTVLLYILHNSMDKCGREGKALLRTMTWRSMNLRDKNKILHSTFFFNPHTAAKDYFDALPRPPHRIPSLNCAQRKIPQWVELS